MAKTTEQIIQSVVGPIRVKQIFRQLSRHSVTVKEDKLQDAIDDVMELLFLTFKQYVGVLHAYEILKEMVHTACWSEGSFITYLIIDGRTATFHKMFQENKTQMMIHFDASCGRFDLHFYGTTVE